MNRLTSALVGFAVGAAAGTVVALLYAPEKGKKTRDTLSFRLKKYRDLLSDLVGDIVEGKDGEPASSNKVGKREEVEQLLNEADDLLKKMKQQKKRA